MRPRLAAALHHAFAAVRRAARTVGLLPLVFFVLIALPGLVHLAGLGRPAVLSENRRPAPAPGIPRSWAAALQLAAGTDAFLRDGFGLRAAMVSANNWLRWRAFGELATSRIVVGRNGRLFLGAHDGSPPNSLLLPICGVGVDDATVEAAADSARRLLDRGRLASRDATLLIIPSAARLYPEDLPATLAARCATARPAVDRIVERLGHTDIAARVVYPLVLMERLKKGFDVIPRPNFHWAGEAPLRVAEDLAETRWGMARSLTLPLRAGRGASDLNYVNPGLAATSPINEANTRAAGVRSCVGRACGPIGGHDIPALEIYRRPAPGEALLVIADSFGDEIARTFTEQFGAVWLPRANTLANEPPAVAAAMLAATLAALPTARVLVIVHDANLLTGLVGLRPLTE